MFDPTKPVQTRDGRKARIVATDIKSPYPICAIVTTKTGSEQPETFTEQGGCYVGTDSYDLCDLINIPVKHEYYLNIDARGEARVSHGIWSDREEADRQASQDRVTCKHIEFEDGQFDE